MKKAIIAALAALALSGCTNPDGARATLKAHGYTDIKIGGYDLFGCGRDDFYATSFTAKTPAGVAVKGVVCQGIFKGSTIRTH